MKNFAKTYGYITVQEVFNTYAKLKLWFELSPNYRRKGFFDGIDDMMKAFSHDDGAAYDIVKARLLNSPARIKEKNREIEEGTMPDDYPWSLEDWVQETQEVDDLFFCIAVCVLAHEPGMRALERLVARIGERLYKKGGRGRLMAVLSTAYDLNTDVDELLRTRKAVI